MMKFSRKIGRSSQNSTSISRKKKKSNEKNGLGKSGKRSRGHKRAKTYKRVKIFHKGGAHEIKYDAGPLEYKKISLFPSFFNKDKTEVSVSISVIYGRNRSYITIKLQTGNKLMKLEISINNYTGNLDDLKRTIKSSVFTSGKDEKYTFNFPSNHSFFVEIIEKSTRLLNECQEEQKKLEEEEKRRKRVEAVWNAINSMHFDTYIYQAKSYKIITQKFQYWMEKKKIYVTEYAEYERFKTEQITRAEEEKRLINGTEYHDVEKDNRILLVDAILNRILRTKLLLMLTSHFINEFKLQQSEAIEVLKPTDRESYVEYEEGNTLLECIIKKIIEMQDRKEEQEGLIKNMIEQMMKIHSERVKSELNFKIIEEELIGTNHDGVWTRDMGWAVLSRDILFIPPWE